MLKPEDILKLNIFEVKFLNNLQKYLGKLKIEDTKLKAVKDIARNNLIQSQRNRPPLVNTPVACSPTARVDF